MCLCFQIAVFTQGAQFLDEFWTEERISFVLTVSRENLLNGTLSSLVSADDMELKKPLRVSCAKSVLVNRHAVCAVVYMYIEYSSKGTLSLCMPRTIIMVYMYIYM